MQFLKSIRFVLLFSLFLTFPVYAAENYKIDSSHSYVLWHISHFGFSNPSGKWHVNGTLTLDESNPKLSKVEVTVPVAEVVTGIPKLDEHLKGKDFFDVLKYPTATFVSDKIIVENKKSAKVIGTLNLHGVSRTVTLFVTLNKVGESPITHKKTVGFSGHADIKRSDFGLKTYLPGLGNEVKLQIETEATLS